VGVPVRGLDLDQAVAHFQHRNVEGAATQVKNQDRLIGLLVQAVSQRRGRRLIDNALHIQAGDLARVLGGLALRIVEIGRHGNHRVGDRLAQVGLGVGL